MLTHDSRLTMPPASLDVEETLDAIERQYEQDERFEVINAPGLGLAIIRVDQDIEECRDHFLQYLYCAFYEPRGKE